MRTFLISNLQNCQFIYWMVSTPTTETWCFPRSPVIFLGLIASGSGGSTWDQLLGFNFLQFNSVEELNFVYSWVIANVSADGSPMGGPHLSVANGAWIDQSVFLTILSNMSWTIFVRLLPLLLIFCRRIVPKLLIFENRWSAIYVTPFG